MNGPVILFDFDGTIADSIPCLLDIYNHIAPAIQAEPLTRQRFDHLRSLPPRQAFKAMGVSTRRLTRLIPHFLKEYHSLIHRVQPFPGITELLQQFAAMGVTLGLLSSNSQENLQQFLSRHGIGCFSFVYGTSGILGKQGTIRKCMRANSIARERLIYVGDEVRDIRSARKCGVKCAAVTWGMHSEALLATRKPDSIIREAGDLLLLPGLIAV